MFLLVGSIFGIAYLFMLVISMAFQTGHIAFIVKQNDNHAIPDKHAEYMMATLTNPYESLLGVFKSIWAIFLAVSFWQNGEILMAVLMLLFGMLIFYYLFMMLDVSVVKGVKLFSKLKPHPFVVNLETLFFSSY